MEGESGKDSKINMNTYITNKVVSFLGVVLCIALTFIFLGNSMEQWQAILLSIIIFGYSHFFLGFLYQIKSFFRKPNPWQYMITFSVLTIFSVALAFFIFKYLGFVPALLIGFLYFLFHGLLNEQTLILRQTGIKVPLIFIVSLGVFVMTLLTYSIPDQTFFFDRYLQFEKLNDFLVTYMFNNFYLNIVYFKPVFVVGCVLSGLVLLFAWLKYGFGKLASFLAVTFSVIAVLVFVFGPPAYIYMYLIVVGYHFMTWLLFYLVEKKKLGQEEYRKFIKQNVLMVLPLLVLAYLFFQPNPPSIVFVVFDYQLFAILTYVHISTSFMNDAWLQRIQTGFFDWIAR